MISETIRKVLSRILYQERTVRLRLLQRLKSAYARDIFSQQCYSIGQNISLREIPDVVGFGKIVIGDDVAFRGKIELVVPTHIYPNSTIAIGDRTHVGKRTSIRAAQSIYIGNDCLIASDVRIYDYNGHPLDPAKRLMKQGNSKDEVRSVVVEDNVWIGQGAFIQQGVTIGTGAIVAANSVVTKDVKPNTVVFGVPARPILWLDKETKSAVSGKA